MLAILLKRFISMVLIMAVISIILFLVFESDKLSVAAKVLGQYSLMEQRLSWLEQNGYNEPAIWRYLAWVGNFVTGDWGRSIQFDEPVWDLVMPRLANTGILGGFVAIHHDLDLAGARRSVRHRRSKLPRPRDHGVLGADNFGSRIRFRHAPGCDLRVLAGWLPGTSPFSDGFALKEIILPTAVLVIYNFGYYTRMTRASMAEVMMSQYVRTAILKGIPYKDVVMKHALRNALIAPFTVMVLQLNYLLSGVIVVEVFFAFKGFGKLLYDSACSATSTWSRPAP